MAQEHQIPGEGGGVGVVELTFHQASLRSVGHSSTFVEVWVQSPTLQEPRDEA